MPLEAALESAPALPARNAWGGAATRLLLAWAALFAVNWPEWSEMVHQWWDIDTYGHIVLVPPILGWLVWLRRAELDLAYSWASRFDGCSDISMIRRSKSLFHYSRRFSRICRQNACTPRAFWLWSPPEFILAGILH